VVPHLDWKKPDSNREERQGDGLAEVDKLKCSEDVTLACTNGLHCTCEGEGKGQEPREYCTVQYK
jgi:hypothetical protein